MKQLPLKRYFITHSSQEEGHIMAWGAPWGSAKVGQEAEEKEELGEGPLL